MNRVRTGELPWTKLDRAPPDDARPDPDGLQASPVSRRPKRTRSTAPGIGCGPWPDAVAGLTRLKKKFIIAPLSNGNIALMTDMAKHAGLPWDCILGAELVRHYKPDREVYQSAADILDLSLRT